MKILRVWFEDSGDAFVSVYWERGSKHGRKASELLCMTNSASKAGRIVLAMRAMMRLDPKPPRPKAAGFRSVWSAAQHKWQLVASKSKAKAPKKKSKAKAPKKKSKRKVEERKKPKSSGEWQSSNGSLRDTDWYDKDARFRGSRGDTW